MPEEQEKSKKPRTTESGTEAPALSEMQAVEETKLVPAKTVARAPAKATPDRGKRGLAAVLGFKRKTSKLRPR
jgi:hypothetical protein